MKVALSADLNADVLSMLDENASAGYVSGGDSVSQIKALTLCLRAEWFRVHGHVKEREQLSDGSLKYLIGTALGKLLNLDEGSNEYRVTMDLPSGRVSGRLDARTIEGYPVELKVTWGGSKGKPNGQYVEQLVSYMSATSQPVGFLIVAHMVGGGERRFSPSPYLEVFKVEWDYLKEGLEWNIMLESRLSMVLAESLPEESWTHYPWECKYCGYNQDRGGPCPAPKGTKTDMVLERDYVTE